jgi:hypothetical protein
MRKRARNTQVTDRPGGSLHQLDSLALDALAAVRILETFAQELAVEDPRVQRSALELILAVERFVGDVSTGNYLYGH